jgi:hypothetical protein
MSHAYGECFVQPCGRIDVSRWGIFDVAIKKYLLRCVINARVAVIHV